MGLDDVKNPDFVACNQQRCRPACVSAKSNQRLCCLLSGNQSSQTCFMQIFIILTNLSS